MCPHCDFWPPLLRNPGDGPARVFVMYAQRELTLITTHANGALVSLKAHAGDYTASIDCCAHTMMKWWNVRGVQMGVSIWGAVHLHCTSPWSSGKCVRYGVGRSRVRLSAGSYQDLVNWYNLLTGRTVCGRAVGNTPWRQKQTRSCRNSVVALQNHCSYEAPTTNHHIKHLHLMTSPWSSGMSVRFGAGNAGREFASRPGLSKTLR